MRTTSIFLVLLSLVPARLLFAQAEKNDNTKDPSFLIYGSYFTFLLPKEKFVELKETDSILINPLSVLRPFDEFNLKIEGDESLFDIVTWFQSEYERNVGPNQLVVVYIERDRILRFYHSKGKESGDEVKAMKKIEMAPGNLICFGVR